MGGNPYGKNRAALGLTNRLYVGAAPAVINTTLAGDRYDGPTTLNPGDRVPRIDDPEYVGGLRRLSLGPTHPDPWWPIAGMGSGYLETTANQIRDFVDAIVSGGSARPSFADGARVQRVVDAVIASARSETWVDVRSQVAATA